MPRYEVIGGIIMQNRDFTQNANLYRSDGAGVDIIGSFQTYSEHVGGGAVVHGDHVHPNPWSYGYFRFNYPVGKATVAQGHFGGAGNNLLDIASYSGPLQGIGFASVGSELDIMQTNAYNKAISRLSEKVRGSLDISVAMGEASETRRMLNALGKWDRWFKGFGPKRWASEWLEYTYGWKPLLSDIYDAAKELQRKNEALMTFNASAKEKKPLSTSRDLGYPDFSGVGGSGYAISDGPHVISNVSGNLVAICKVSVTLSPPTSTTNAARWTSLNPLSIAWELMPYSFVIDWFVDVGSFLRDAETALLFGPRFLSGYVSTTRIRDTHEVVQYNARGISHYFSGVVVADCQSNVKAVTFNRSLLGSYPLPRLPQVNTDLSWRRLTSAAALLAQQLGRK